MHQQRPPYHPLAASRLCGSIEQSLHNTRPDQPARAEPTRLKDPLLHDSSSGSGLDSGDESDDSELGDFPAFDKRRAKAKESRLQDRRNGHTGQRTQRQRKYDNNLNRGSLEDIDLKHRPLVSQAIEIFVSLLLDEDPLGLQPAKKMARAAMRQASEEDGKLTLKPNKFVIRLVSSVPCNAKSWPAYMLFVDVCPKHKYPQTICTNSS
jgi:hypothetical protein